MHETHDYPEVEDPSPGLLNAPVAPVSLVNGVAERFRQAIISGTLKPGEEINESHLAERLGVARNTLREAVRILIGEGLLEKLPNRSSRVRTLTPEIIWEIMTARAVVEGFGARILAQRLTPAKIKHLRHICSELLAAARTGDRERWASWDFRLHYSIMELSGHSVLFESWVKMSAWVRLMFALQRHDAVDMLRNAQRHQEIVEAILSGDADLAEARLKTDLLNQQELERFTGLAEVISGSRAESTGQRGPSADVP